LERFLLMKLLTKSIMTADVHNSLQAKLYSYVVLTLYLKYLVTD